MAAPLNLEEGPDEYNRVSAFESAKEIWDCLKTAHEGTEQVKESKIDMLTSRYENFKMKEGETIHDMFTKFSSITNELRSLGESISMNKQVRKVLRILPKSWESKVDSITEAKDLKVLTMDALIGHLKTHEMNRNYDLSKKEAKKDKSLMLKYKSDEDSSDDDDMCGKSGHFIRDCPLLKNENKEHQKHRSDKENRRNLVPGNRDRKAAADMVIKRALAAWGILQVIQKILMSQKMYLWLLCMRRKLSSMKFMLDSVIELTSERDTMNAELEILTENKVQFEETMSRMVSLESNNSEFKNQLYQITEEAEKLNGKSNSLQAEIQEKLKNSETNFSLSIEKSNKLEQDIVKLKEELEKSLKWTKSSKLLSNATNQRNEVKFTSEKCTVVSLTTNKVILTAHRSKNMYVENLEISHGDDLTCLSAQNENVDLWHRRLGHVSSSLLNKLISKDLVRGLPKMKFAENKICEACVKGKQIRSSFKPKNQVTSSRTLELLHMDLCGPLKVQSRNGKKYILVIVDDYSRYTWTRFLRSKADTTDELVVSNKSCAE
nr:uncharacterized protein LOC112940164 [Solanum lycopersicum]